MHFPIIHPSSVPRSTVLHQGRARNGTAFLIHSMSLNLQQPTSLGVQRNTRVEETINRGQQPTFLKPPDAQKNILDEP